MKLSHLMHDCDPLWESAVNGLTIGDPDILSIHSRSGDVTPGGLFIAIRGFKADGHAYIEDALRRGAVAVVAEQNVSGNPSILTVSDSRKAMAAIAARFYGNPSASMVLIGVTGTNGKTTTTSILESIFQEAGHTVGVIGTLNWRYLGRAFSNPVTTPDSIDLQQMLHEMNMAGVTHVMMEVSSHGIDLYRTSHCSFDVGVFTNLSQDHLDYHESMENYFACKKRLFTEIMATGPKAGNAAAVINVTDPHGRLLAAGLPMRTLTVGIQSGADISSRRVTDAIEGLSGTIDFQGTAIDFTTLLTGGFNLENILCAAGAAWALGLDSRIIKKGIEACKGVPGRLERVAVSSGRFVFVDYAHTPGALERILETLASRAPARLISVVGCGGDRDRTKRPVMGQAALKYSDLAIITSDNPRTEDPLSIIRDILAGIQGQGFHEYTRETLSDGFTDRGYVVEPDRKTALETAMRISRPMDIIVAAGKGHETYQVLKTGKIDFDDRQVLRQAAARWLGTEDSHD